MVISRSVFLFGVLVLGACAADVGPPPPAPGEEREALAEPGEPGRLAEVSHESSAFATTCQSLGHICLSPGFCRAEGGTVIGYLGCTGSTACCEL